MGSSGGRGGAASLHHAAICHVEWLQQQRAASANLCQWTKKRGTAHCTLFSDAWKRAASSRGPFSSPVRWKRWLTAGIRASSSSRLRSCNCLRRPDPAGAKLSRCANGTACSPTSANAWVVHPGTKRKHCHTQIKMWPRCRQCQPSYALGLQAGSLLASLLSVLPVSAGLGPLVLVCFELEQPLQTQWREDTELSTHLMSRGRARQGTC